MSQSDRAAIAAELADRLDYDPNTGVLSWRDAAGWQRRIPAGSAAGSKNAGGYIEIRFKKIAFYAHRIIWQKVYGRLPSRGLDHINGNPCDNRLCNLREASQLHNLHNTRRPVTNTSGVKGVYRCKKSGRWVAEIKNNGRRISIGRFARLEDAAKARQEAAIRLHGEFARLE